MNFIRYDSVQLKKFDLYRDDSGSTRYYVNSEGKKYLSVTSFVSKFSDNKAEIEKWKQSIGEEEAHKVLVAAGTRGTAIHLACENLLLNKDWSDISMFYKQDFIAMKKHLESHVDNVFALEHQMYSDALGLAGTVDCIAEYDGEMCIIDFKTSSRLKYRNEINTYFLQCAAYGIMVYERYKIKISNIVILMVVEGQPNVEVFVEPLIKWGKELLKLKKEYNENE